MERTTARSSGGARALAAIACSAIAGLVAPPACKTPTEVTVAVASELGYRGDMAVSVQIDREGSVESAPPRVVTRSAWTASGDVGTVVVVPNSDEDGVMVRIVLAAGREPSTCSAADASGCVVVRRRVRFTQGESTNTRIVLRPACLGVFCDAQTSCAVDGRCGSLDGDTPSDAGAPDAPLVDGGDPYVNAVLIDRPRHYYRLDEPEGATVAKDMMGRADGTYEGVKLGVTGGIRTTTNTGAFFGGGARVTIPKVEDLRGAFSIEAWARADTADGPKPTIVERVDTVGSSLFGYRMSKPPGTQVAFELFRGGATFSADARANRFAGYSHFVAVSKGSGGIELWLDGTRADQVEPSDGPPSSAVVGPLVIGASRAGANAFTGAIDEVAIYDYPLDEQQIKRHYAVAEQK